METNSQQLIWTVVSNPKESDKTVKAARSSRQLAIEQIPYTLEQVAAFARKVQAFCYKVTCREYEEDENLGIKYDESITVTYEPIPVTDWVVEDGDVIGFVPSAYPYAMLSLKAPENPVFFLGSHSKIKGYSYDNSEYTYAIAEQPCTDE